MSTSWNEQRPRFKMSAMAQPACLEAKQATLLATVSTGTLGPKPIFQNRSSCITRELHTCFVHWLWGRNVMRNRHRYRRLLKKVTNCYGQQCRPRRRRPPFKEGPYGPVRSRAIGAHRAELAKIRTLHSSKTSHGLDQDQDCSIL